MKRLSFLLVVLLILGATQVQASGVVQFPTYRECSNFITFDFSGFNPGSEVWVTEINDQSPCSDGQISEQILNPTFVTNVPADGHFQWSIILAGRGTHYFTFLTGGNGTFYQNVSIPPIQSVAPTVPLANPLVCGSQVSYLQNGMTLEALQDVTLWIYANRGYRIPTYFNVGETSATIIEGPTCTDGHIMAHIRYFAYTGQYWIEYLGWIEEFVAGIRQVRQAPNTLIAPFVFPSLSSVQPEAMSLFETNNLIPRSTPTIPTDFDNTISNMRVRPGEVWPVFATTTSRYWIQISQFPEAWVCSHNVVTNIDVLPVLVRTDVPDTPCVARPQSIAVG